MSMVCISIDSMVEDWGGRTPNFFLLFCLFLFYTILFNSLDDSSITNTFKLISSNFWGLRDKKVSFLQLIESESPYLFLAPSPGWNSTVLSSEFFSSEYQLFCSDRNDCYGGVFFRVILQLDVPRSHFPTQLRQLLVKYSQLMVKLW